MKADMLKAHEEKLLLAEQINRMVYRRYRTTIPIPIDWTFLRLKDLRKLRRMLE